MNTNTFTISQMLVMHHTQMLITVTFKTTPALSPVPNLGAAVLEELKEFRYHNVEGPVQSVAVQQLRRVLADLLQCSKRALRHGHTQRGCQIKTQTYRDTEERMRVHQKIKREREREQKALNALNTHPLSSECVTQSL